MTAGTKLGSSLAVALAVIAALGIGAYMSTTQLLETNRLVVHTHLVIEKLDSLSAALTDAETGQRGFLLTGQEEYLAPYNAARSVIGGEIETLGRLLSDNPVQVEILARIRALAEKRLAAMQEVVNLRKQSGPDAASEAIRTGNGRQVMEAIGGMVAEMQGREQRLLDARESASKESAKRSIIMVAIGTPLSLLSLAIFAMVITGKTNIRRFRAQSGSNASSWGRLALQYSFAVAAVAVGTGARLWLMRAFGPLPTFVTLYPAVLLVASVAGGGPGVFATVVAALAADYFFLSPIGQFKVDAPNDMLALILFTGTNLLLSVLMGQLRQAQWAEAVSAAQEEELDLLDRGTILALDPEHRIVRWSDGCRRLYGYEAQEAVGRSTHELFQALPNESFKEVHRALLEQGHWQGERIRRAKDGTELTIAVLWALRLDEKGQPHSIMELSADITDRKRAEEALRDSRARFATTLASIGDAVVATDVECAITFLNPEAERLTGWPLQEALGTPVSRVFNIINEFTRAEVESPVVRVLREGIVVGLANHTLLVRKDGTEVPIDDSGAPIKDADGVTKGVVLVFRDVTERKEAEEALRESEERFRRAAQCSNDFIYERDLQTGLVQFFGDIDGCLGYAPGTFPRTLEGWMEHVHPDDLLRVTEAVREGFEQGGAYGVEYRLRTSDGSYAEWSDRGVILRDASGTPVKNIGAATDITQRKRTEEAVRESDERLHFALSVSRTGAWDLDLEDHSAFRSVEHDRVFGYETLLPQWTYEMFLEHILPEDRAEVDRKFQKAMQEKGNWDFECRIVRIDGVQRWIWACGQHRRNAQGFHDRMVGIVQDITERKRSEAVLRESERKNEFLADLVRNASQPFAVGYPDGRLGLMNPAFEQLTGYGADELRAMDWAATLTPPEWSELERQKLAELHQSGEPVRYQKEYLRRDGTRVPIELLVHLARDEEGGSDYYYSFLTDITERKQAEEALQHARDELEHRVQERTAELRQVNLELTQKIEEHARTLEALRKSEQSLAEAQHIGHMGSWDWNFGGNELFWSDELYRIFGLMPQALPLDYARVLERVHPEDRGHLDASVDRALRGGREIPCPVPNCLGGRGGTHAQGAGRSRV